MARFECRHVGRHPDRSIGASGLGAQAPRLPGCATSRNRFCKMMAIRHLRKIKRNPAQTEKLPLGTAFRVGMARFELATSWSQTRRDNRATLHPGSQFALAVACGEGGIRTRGTVLPVRQFSKLLISATHPPHQPALFVIRGCKNTIRMPIAQIKNDNSAKKIPGAYGRGHNSFIAGCS
jgi:hypothetical protein